MLKGVKHEEKNSQVEKKDKKATERREGIKNE